VFAVSHAGSIERLAIWERNILLSCRHLKPDERTQICG
jgi:hypothetical protein